MKKRILSGVLSLCLSIGMLSGISAFAAPAATLQSMIDDAKEGAQIVLSADYEGAVSVAADKKVTIDLNGHTLTGTAGYALDNQGTLIIEDNVGGGKITLEGNPSSESVYHTIKNSGTMTVKDTVISSSTSGAGIAQGINNSGILSVDGAEINASTSGSKWAIALYNTGTVKQLNGTFIGEIKNTETNDVNALAVSNEADAVIEEITGGQFIGRLNNNGIAFGIRNRGIIQKISGGEIHAVTTGNKYAYGLHNEASGIIQKILGGRMIGDIKRERNGNNALGIRNDGIIETIAGGEFRGNILGEGNAYGIRNDQGQIKSISGGMYRGNNVFNSIYKQGGDIIYADGFEALNVSNHVGYQYVAKEGSIYTEVLDEYENHVATFFFDKSGNQIDALGDIRGSYTIYCKNQEQPSAKDRKTVVQVPEDFAKIGTNVTLTAQTTDKPVYYFLGSSVTIGFANNAVSFADYMAEENDWICHKRAISGTTLVDSGSKSYVQRLENDFPANARIDHLICQLSTNDATQNKPFGQLSDSYEADALDRTTIYGALEYIAFYCANVLNCELSFYTNPKYSNASYEKMVDAVYEVADKWHLKVIDFYNYRDMEKLPDETLRSYMSDEIHPNEAGYRWMAGIMGDFLKKYKPQNITLDRDNLELKTGAEEQLTAIVEPEEAADKSVKWTSSAPGIVKVEEDTGKVTALAVGQAVITAETVNGRQAFCRVTVIPSQIKVQKMVIKGKKTMTEGQTATFKAAIEPSDASEKTVSWKSSDSKVASIDPKSGKVTAKKAGKTKITVSARDGSGITNTMTVTVKPKKVTKLTVKVKKRKAVVNFKKVSGIKKYTVRLYKNNKLLKTAKVNKNKVTINKKLSPGSYTIKIQYEKNKVKSDDTIKKFKVKK